jgi:hypothetical protein
MSNKSVAQTQKLRGLIEERIAGDSFGSTKTGSDWCIKALHPSDPMTEVSGIPDHSAVPSLLMNYQSTYTLSPSQGAEGIWSFDATLMPHPINFMYLKKIDSVYPLGEQSNFMNAQIAGSTHFEKFKSFKSMVQRWRLAYMGVSIYQDGPDLANQGSIVVSQAPVQPMHMPFSVPTRSTGVASHTWPWLEGYTDEDHPDFSTSQSMPSAYFGRSRDGAYVPLKLTETCQDWVSEKDQITPCDLYPWTNPDSCVMEVPVAGVPIYPHFNLMAMGLNYGGVWDTAQATSCMLSGAWAMISAKNLSVATSFTFFVRCGLEMQVSPSSTLAPQLALSPPHDEVALNNYFSIARELKDAYPVEYNDKGKMWSVISSAVRRALHYLKVIPGLRGAATLAKGAVIVGDAVVANRAARKAASKKPQQEAPKPKPVPQRKK